MPIRLQDMTPEVYYKQSRDFQFIGRLFDVVLNSVKTNADLITNYPISENSDSRLIDLMTLTLGFKSKHNYNVQQLTALCSAFIEIIRNKGNLQAVAMATNTLANADGVVEKVSYEVSKDKKTLTLFIPETVTDINLLRDLLDYIIPAGMVCRIVRESEENKEANDRAFIHNSLNWEWANLPQDAPRDGAGIGNTWLATLPQVNGEVDYKAAPAEAKPGMLPNTVLWKTENTTIEDVIPSANEGDE